MEGNGNFWQWLTGGVVSAVGTAFGYHKYIDGRLEKKADKLAVNSAVDDLKQELGVQRGHIAKIFDQIRDGELKSEARHRELLMHLLKGKEE